MYDNAIFVEVLTSLGRYGDFSSSPVVALEKGQRIAACYNASALVVQQRRWIALEDSDVVVKGFESNSGAETT